MTSYIAQWHEVIRDGSFDNTYKMAWARSLVELATEHHQDVDSEQVVPFTKIADRFLRSFWDQTIFFDLNQSWNVGKPPEVLQHTRELITAYQMASDTLPVKYIRVDFEKLGLEKHRNEALTKIVATLPQDVSWRFMRVNGCEYPLYQLDRSGRRLTFRGEHIRLIAEYSDFLLDAISYRWTQMLEKFNHSPRIAQKVRGVAGDKEPRRGNLTKFRKYLDMDDVTSDTCFQCRRRILDKAPDTSQKPSVDHVIPWSFMYSDDLWNLAYCHTGCNSSKSNRIPNSDTIERLEARNKRLLEHLPKRKVHSEMQMAIENNYLRRFWISFKG